VRERDWRADECAGPIYSPGCCYFGGRTLGARTEIAAVASLRRLADRIIQHFKKMQTSFLSFSYFVARRVYFGG